jgi:hypothetical protein
MVIIYQGECMTNFKGIKFSENKYGPFITVKPRILYSGFIPKRNIIGNLIFPKIIFKGGLNIIRQLNPNEPQHSLILGSILNPNSKHGYGDVFLKEFFNIVINDNDFIYDTNEKWFVTIEKYRFDIGIRNKNNTKIIIIENKSNWAEDQPNQLYRYWLNGIYKQQYRLVKLKIQHWAKIIYLSPSYEKGYSNQSVTRPPKEDKNYPSVVPENIIKTVYYREEVFSWLNKCMELVENTSDMYFYLKQYQDFWRQ